MPNAIINVGQTGGQVNISTATAPATPAVGVVTLYAGTDKALHALNSDGTDITIAAAGAASPITVVQTNSLASTAVGATATSNTSISIGYNSTVQNNDGNIAIGSGAISNSQVGGLPARSTTVIGSYACAVGPGNIALGQNSLACGSDSGLAIGNYAKACCDYGIAIGPVVGSSAIKGIAIGYGICNCANSSIALGNGDGTATTAVGAACSIAIGNTPKIFPGATGTVVLGNSSVGGTGACNSVVIGNSSRATGVDSIAIGDVAVTTAACAIAIGNAACSTGLSSIAIGNSKTAPGPFDINIGGCTTNSITSTDGNNTIIGGLTNCILQGSRSSIIGSYNSCVNNTNGYATIIGSGNSFTCGANYFGFLGGAIESCSAGYSPVIIGAVQSCITNSNSGYSGIYSGANHTISSSSCNNVILGGRCGIIGSAYCNTVILGGLSVTADRSNTAFVQHLVATGQAASLTNAVGSTGGSVTLNWDNSNIQTLTLTSSITTLTKSNPIDGAVYTLFVTQGGTGGKTVSWGSDVDWPGGTPPTLSTAAGATDAVSLVYIAGVTGYYGNANLNFS